MNKISIKLKITLWYMMILIIISSITLFAMLAYGNDILIRDASDKIVRSVENTERMIANPKKMPARKMPPSDFFDKGVHIAVYDGEYNLLNGLIPFEFGDDIEFNDNGLNELTFDGTKYLTYVKKVITNDSEEMWIKAVISVGDESQMMQSVWKTNFLVTIVLIFAASLGGYFIIKRSFKPVDKISKTANEICQSSDLSQRIAIGDGNDEIYRLANTFDKMLDRIETTLDNEKQFTSDASHELRTPVAVISSECEYILDCARNLEEARDSVAAIKRQTDKMSKLISELLTVSRMDRNTQQVNFEIIDISELLSFVCDEQEEIHPGAATLERKIQENITAMGDHFLLARMFINLISNAYQYGKEDGRIIVTLDEITDNVIFSVQDDGIGISEENIPKIWERFYQVDSSRTNENGSTGLGLSMVKGIVECHNGTITVKSELGKGSKFEIILPKYQN